MPSFNGALSYHWVVTGPGSYTLNEYGNTASITFDAAGTYYIYVYVITSCGIVQLGSDQRSIDIYESGGYYRFSPNPASTELVVTNNSEARQTASLKSTNNKIFEARLYDNKGKILRMKKNAVNEKRIVFDINDIPNNTYYLHIIEGKNVIKKQVIIHH